MSKLQQVNKSYEVIKLLVEYELMETLEANTKKLLSPVCQNTSKGYVGATEASVPSDTTKSPEFSIAVKTLMRDKSSPLYIGKKSKPINKKTRDELLKWLNGYFLELFKNKHLKDIRHSDLDDAFYLLTQYPQTKFNPYKHMSEQQRIDCAHKQDVPEALRQQSGMTRAKTAIYKLFDYYYCRNVLDINPVDMMRFRDFKEGKIKGAYTLEQVKLLVDYCTKSPIDHFTSSILIMVYSGLRNGEIVKLQRNDILLHQDGFYYFDVKGTKTPNAERQVPIHKHLIKYGILEYFDTKSTSISSQALTQWYGKFVTKIGLESFDTNGNMLTLYSLRHSFATALANSGVSDLHIEALMGHSHKGTKSNYIAKIDIKPLQKAISETIFVN
jgi:integrase